MSLSTLSPSEIDALYIRAKRELKKIPGVAGVGFGYKVTGGERTPQLAFIVDVVQKKPLAELSPEEIVPRMFEGVPVDVQIVAQTKSGATCQNLTQYSTLVGGAAITNQKTPGSYEVGTLGCFALLSSENGLDRYAILSNNHVLAAGGAVAGENIYQPKRLESGANIVIDSDNWGGVVAKIADPGQMGDYNWVYPEDVAGGAVAQPFYIDVATAKIQTSFSSWCGTNTGVTLKNEIDGLAIGGSSAVADIERIKASDLAAGTYTVYKVGSRTGRTTGHVSAIDRTIDAGQNCIEVTFDSASCAGIVRFFDHGDSGSVLVNGNRKVIGIMSRLIDADPTVTYACHIHPALARVNVTVLSEASLPSLGSDSILKDSNAIALNPMNALRSRLQGHPQQAIILDTIERHRLELVRLVNHHRPVTIAWQRGKGPAFMGHYLHALQHPEHQIPAEIQGVSPAVSMQMFLDALQVHGSVELRADVQAHGPMLIEALQGADSFDHALSMLESNFHSPENR